MGRQGHNISYFASSFWQKSISMIKSGNSEISHNHDSHNYEIKGLNYGTLSDKYEIKSGNYYSQDCEIKSKHSSHKLSKYEILSYNYETAITVSPNYEINHILT